jgi:hypothetical protein
MMLYPNVRESRRHGEARVNRPSQREYVIASLLAGIPDARRRR